MITSDLFEETICMSETQQLPSHKLCLCYQVLAVIVAIVISVQKNGYLLTNNADD